MGNEAYERYVALRPKTLGAVAAFLAQRGLPFDEGLRSTIQGSRTAASNMPPLSVYLAEALMWTRHAKRSPDFVTVACRYFIGGDESVLAEADQMSWRFGPEKLRVALGAMRELYVMFRRADLPTTLAELESLQEACIGDIASAKDRRQMWGLGPWLFLAPFKIHVTCHQELWADPGIDSIKMPLGTQVVRALRVLAHDGVIPREEFPQDDGQELASGGAFLSAMATVVYWQAEQKKLADSAGSHIPHINSALYELGYQGP